MIKFKFVYTQKSPQPGVFPMRAYRYVCYLYNSSCEQSIIHTASAGYGSGGDERKTDFIA